MTTPRSLLLAATSLAALPLVAGPPTQQEIADALSQPTISIRSGTFTQEYVLALDEIRVKQRNGGAYKLSPVPAPVSGGAVLQAALAHEKTRGEKADLIVYAQGADRDDTTKQVLTKEILMQVDKGVRARTIATGLGARVTRLLPWAPDLYMLEATDAGAALVIADKLRKTEGVLYAEVQLASRPINRLIPNDPLFPQQWHLTYGFANVTTTWDNYLGNGIRIGIIDDGMQTGHPDLLANADVSNDIDYNGDDADPTPQLNNNPNLIPPPPTAGGQTTDDFHGTAVAGVAAARGSNAIGISGVAPRSTLVGMRLTADLTTDLEQAEAMTHRNDIIQIKNNSWGPADDGQTLQDMGPLTEAAMQEGTRTGRGGRGTIYVWAAGNGGARRDNSNKDGYANSIYTIAVAATNRRTAPGPPFPAFAAAYSEPGANIVVAAPGGDFATTGATNMGITTTDLTGNDGNNYAGAPDLTDRNYSNRIQGTSFSAPFVSGVVALILQANPNLGWRDVQEVLISTAYRLDATDPEWVVNGAGFHFHHRYGAGLVSVADAIPFVLNNYSPLGAQTRAQAVANAITPIPDAPGGGAPGIPATREINVVFGPARLEHVELTLNIAHPYRGDLAIELISPAGTVSRMMTSSSDSGNNYTDWTFMTVRNWGEGSQGIWQVRVIDEVTRDAGTLSRCTLTMYGTGSAGGGAGGGGGVIVGGSNAGGGNNGGGGSNGGGGVGGEGTNSGGGLVGVPSNFGGGTSGGGGTVGGGGAVMGPAGAGGGATAGGGSAGPSAGGGPAGAGMAAGGGR